MFVNILSPRHPWNLWRPNSSDWYGWSAINVTKRVGWQHKKSVPI